MSKPSIILHKRTESPGAIFGTDFLSAGELSMNIADGKFFIRKADPQGISDVFTFSNDEYNPFVLDAELSGCAPQYGGNTINQVFANVLGGYRNDVSGAGSTTVNGENNDIQGDFAFIGSGADNKILPNGDFSAILGGRNNAISHQNSFTLGSNLSSHADNFTYVNNISGTFWGEGINIRNLNASNISSGTLAAARLPAFSGDITTVVGSASARVVKLQGNEISTQAPAIGQMLQWSGNAWVPGSIPNGGSGGGGINYYLNYGTSPDAPFGNLTGTLYELGRTSTTLPLTSITFESVSQVSWDTLATFITDHLIPYASVIQAGIWDLNIWMSSTASTQTQMTVRYQVYTYNETLSTTTLVATSDTCNVYDPAVVAQYVVSCIVPQTTINVNDRIYLVLQAQGASPNKDVTIYYNANRPTHIHTTLPSVGGSGLVKVVNGIYQSPASLLVNVDIDDNAQISQAKILNLTTDLGSKLDKTGGTISGNLTVTGSFSTVQTDLWQNTYNAVNSKYANWDTAYSTIQSSPNWNSVYSNVQSNSANWQSVYNSSANSNSVYSTVQSNSANWSSVYSNVQSNSANSASVYSNVQNASANWDVVYADFKRLSSTFLTSETDSQTISFVDATKQLSISNGNTISLSALVGSSLDTGVRSLTSSWDSTYSTVQNNSAVNWNYQGTDLKALSGNWQNAYLTVQSNSTSSWKNSLSADVFADQTIGSINAGDTIPTGTTLQQFVEKLLTATFYPSFIAPTATLTSNLASIVESGTTGITLTVNYDRGAITGKSIANIWQPSTFQNYRAGAATNYVINGTNNGTTSSYTDGAAVIGDGSNSFTSTVTYGTGSQPVDSKGANYLTALAGSTISPGLIVTGRRKAFYGVDSLGNSSATIRSLGSSTLNPSNGTSFTITIPAGTVSVLFAYPSTLQDVTSVKEPVLNAEVKTAFTQTTVSVQGANSYAGTNYKVYRYAPIEAFPSTATYTVTI